MCESQDNSILTYSILAICWGQGWRLRTYSVHLKEYLRVIKAFFILCLCVCACICQTHLTVQLKCIDFIVCKSYLNKVTFFKKGKNNTMLNMCNITILLGRENLSCKIEKKFTYYSTYHRLLLKKKTTDNWFASSSFKQMSLFVCFLMIRDFFFCDFALTFSLCDYFLCGKWPSQRACLEKNIHIIHYAIQN